MLYNYPYIQDTIADHYICEEVWKHYWQNWRQKSDWKQETQQDKGYQLLPIKVGVHTNIWLAASSQESFIQKIMRPMRTTSLMCLSSRRKPISKLYLRRRVSNNPPIHHGLGVVSCLLLHDQYCSERITQKAFGVGESCWDWLEPAILEGKRSLVLAQKEEERGS